MIRLSEELEARIRREGEAAYPNECCGIILGVPEEDGTRRAEALKPVLNAREQEEQYHRFRIESEDLMKAELEARKQKRDVLGFYHSHPDHPSRPSEFDRENALPFYSYIIIAVEQGRSAAITSWELTADSREFKQEEITWR
jgi:proteasome lid subunit RPN8/RPN11